MRFAPAIVGCWLIGLSGVVWGFGLFQGDFHTENFICLAFGLGFGVAGIGVVRGQATILLVGLLGGAAAGGKWAFDQVMVGHPVSAWFLVGVGAVGAFVATAVASQRSSSAARGAQQASLALIAVGGLWDAQASLDPVTAYTLAPFLMVVGAALLAWRPPVAAAVLSGAKPTGSPANDA